MKIHKSFLCCLLKAEIEKGMPITRSIVELITGKRLAFPVEKQSRFDPPA